MQKISFVLLTLAVVLLGACRNNDNNSLFQLVYPPKTFTLPAGTNNFTAAVVAFNNEPTNYDDFLNAGGRTAEEINKIGSNFARLEALDGLDIGFLSEVSVRICPVTQEACTLADEAFFLDDLYRRNITSISLQPNLGNFKDVLSGEQYKLEVVFFLGDIAPYNVDFRLDYGFDAFE